MLTTPAWAEISIGDTLDLSLTGTFRFDFRSVTVQGDGYTLWGGVSWVGSRLLMAGHEATIRGPYANFICYADSTQQVRVSYGPLHGGPPPGGGSIGFVRYGSSDSLAGLAYLARLPERVYWLTGKVFTRIYYKPPGPNAILPDSIVLESREEGEYSFRASALEDRATEAGSGDWFASDATWGVAGGGEWDYGTP